MPSDAASVENEKGPPRRGSARTRERENTRRIGMALRAAAEGRRLVFSDKKSDLYAVFAAPDAAGVLKLQQRVYQLAHKNDDEELRLQWPELAAVRRTGSGATEFAFVLCDTAREADSAVRGGLAELFDFYQQEGISRVTVFGDTLFYRSQPRPIKFNPSPRPR